MKIIAHRCGTDKFPELTIDAAKHSIKSGAHLVEMDVHFTLDNVPVISHDADCSFLFGDDRKIREMTLNEFLSLEYKDKSGYKAITLEEMLKSGVKDILFHIKVGGDKLGVILKLCRKYNIEDSVVFGVGSLNDVKIVKSFNKNIKILAFMYNIENIKEYAGLGVDFIRLWEHWLTDENVLAVQNSGKKLWVMSGNFETVGFPITNDIFKWEKLGVNAILVNNVAQFVK